MVNYASKICQACSADATAATTREIKEFLRTHQDWNLSTEVDFPQLKREYTFRNFADAQKFANLIGDLAEKEGHHPSILLEYGKVTVLWWSHKIKSLHINDFILSSKTEEIYKFNN
tara:strand:- start:850 stop:1197 length:348 start_codon:yes stop_codon:yes gene_type:complete